MSKITNNSPVDFSKYSTVFCDSLEALNWAYKNGLTKKAVIKASSPAMLCRENPNIHPVEKRWSIDEVAKFQSTIKELSKNVFDISINSYGVERIHAIVAAKAAVTFQRILYKVACLEEEDFHGRRLFIRVDGETGPSGNMMNSIWDKLLSSNPLFLTTDYTLQDDRWDVLTTKGVHYWKRFKIAGYETIIYRLAVKLMKRLPNWMFKKEILMLGENELNIEAASSLALRGVKISKVQLKSLPSSKGVTLDENIEALCKMILPIMHRRVEQWVAPSAVEITMSLFQSHLEKKFKQFEVLVSEWEKVITKNDRMRQAVLINAPGNLNGQSLSYVCNKKNIPLIASQHGVTIEISKAHSMLHIRFDNTVVDAMLSYNHKYIEKTKSTYFNNSKHYCVGMPLRLMRMKHTQITGKVEFPIVYISTNLYQNGFTISQKTDYDKFRGEQKIVTEVLSKLPYKVRYKSYPQDNRRYADVDPVFKDAEMAENIEIFSKKIDMRYLISEHNVLVTTCATSTLGWPIMSGKPVVFIDQKNHSPLTNSAYTSMSKGIFVFSDDDENFPSNLRDFLSQPIDIIEKLWQDKEGARRDMIKDYFSSYGVGAGKRAARIILKEYL